MVECAKLYPERVLPIKYEDLVESPVSVIRNVEQYLDIELSQSEMNNFSNVSFSGEMGDPTGQKEYKRISTQSVMRWHQQICNPLRKKWCQNYLKAIPEQDLRLAGYDKSELIQSLDELEFSLKSVPSDLFRMSFGAVYNIVRHFLLHGKQNIILR